MEKLRGIPLDTVYSKLSLDDRFSLLKNIVRLQKSWIDCSFDKYGSLYYKEDLDQDAQSIRYTDRDGIWRQNKRFAIGPATGGFSAHAKLDHKTFS